MNVVWNKIIGCLKHICWKPSKLKKAVVIYVCGGDHHRWPRVVSKVGVGGGAAASQMSFSLHSDL